MPTYLYFCETNNEEFEEFHSIKTELEECLICKEKNLLQHKPKRLIASGGSKGVVVLSGHELTAKMKEDAAKLKKDVYSSEKTYANVLGETRYEQLQSKIDRDKR